MRSHKLFLAMLGASSVLAWGGLLIAGPAAQALTFSHQLAGFSVPEAVAVNGSDDLYVSDSGERQVDVLGPSHEALTTIPGFVEEEALKRFRTPQAIAVDASANLYVADFSRKAVYKFGPAGESLEAFSDPILEPLSEENFLPEGVAVDNSANPLTDSSAGDIYIADPGNKAVYKLSSAGVYESELLGPNPGAGEFFGSPTGLAVDSNGVLYVADTEKHAVYRFSSAGVYESELLGPNPGAGEDFGSPRGLATDSADNLYVADTSLHVVDEFNEKGKYLTQLTGVPAGAAPVSGLFGGAGGLQGPDGVAVDSAGNLYVSDTGDQVVDEFSLLPPAVLVGKASNVSSTGATLNGSVNPHGAKVASCQFEYGTGSPTEHSIPCAGPSIGSGEATVNVSAQLSGLAVNTVYSYRLVIESSRGSTTSTNISEGPEAREFVTASTAPDIVSASATGIEQFGATLEGIIDPRMAPTGYHFAYVEEGAYRPLASNPYEAGAIAPAPDLYTAVNDVPDAVATQTITGLLPGRLYHFALVATGPGGTVVGSDNTFMTPGIPSALVTTGSAIGIDEKAATLAGTIDPQGWSTTYLFQYGTTTTYNASWPTIPITLGSLTGQQTITVYLENLQPNTTYHYRLIAINAANTTPGEDQTFTTTSYPTSIIQETPTLTLLKVMTKPVAKPLTRAERLTKTLRTCRKDHFKKTRTSCEKKAHRTYGKKK